MRHPGVGASCKPRFTHTHAHTHFQSAPYTHLSAAVVHHSRYVGAGTTLFKSAQRQQGQHDPRGDLFGLGMVGWPCHVLPTCLRCSVAHDSESVSRISGINRAHPVWVMPVVGTISSCVVADDVHHPIRLMASTSLYAALTVTAGLARILYLTGRLSLQSIATHKLSKGRSRPASK